MWSPQYHDLWSAYQHHDWITSTNAMFEYHLKHMNVMMMTTTVGLCNLDIMVINSPTNIMTMIPPISRSNYMHTCVLGPMPGLLHTTGDLVIAPQVIEMHWIRIWSNWFRCQEMYRDISVTFNSMDTWSDRFTFHGMHGMNEIKYMQWDIHHWPKCKFRHDLCYDGQSIVTGIV